MKRMIIGVIAVVTLISGCGKTPSIRWVQSVQPVKYYVLSDSKPPHIGTRIGAIITQGTSNGQDLWNTNMTSHKSILIYTIPGVKPSKEVAVKVNGAYYLANAVGTKKPKQP